VSAFATRRWWVFVGALVAWAVLVAARLAQVQIVRGPVYRARARQQQERTVALAARRGSIVDRDGRELAVSVEATSIFAVPDKVEDAARESAALSRLLGIPAREIRERISSDRSFVWIARKVDDDAARAVRDADLPGIHFLPESRRYYPNGSLAANVLGYVGLDGHGLGGLEYEYEGRIHGRDGEMRVARDARQGQYALMSIPGREAEQGSSLEITLDRDIEFVAERELARAVAETGARSGSAVVLDPWTGAVRAMASIPTFDPNRFNDSPPSSWRNRAIADSFEPGSVFKVISGAAAIDAGIIAPEDPVDCGQGIIQVGNYFIHDAEHESFGVIPFAQVIAKSSNVGMVRVGLKLGPERLYSAVRSFGIGEPTEIDLPGENPGIFRSVSEWSGLSNAEISFGQEVSVTPIQLAVTLAAIANGGDRVRPHMLASIDGVPAPVPPPTRILARSTAAEMNDILKMVVQDGTGKRAAVPGFTVAGKTGTAQKAVGRGYARDKYVATFAGYFPADSPRLVIVVTIDEPQGQYFASEVAAPVFAKIAAQAAVILDLPPDGSTLPAAPTPPPISVARAPRAFIPGVVPAALGRDSAGVSEPVLPDLRGLPARRAIAELSRLGIEPKLSGSGLVVRQSPPAGARAVPGAACELALAGPASP
jgi:cell division protein FtsI (penicillin-binding protein 3)